MSPDRRPPILINDALTDSEISKKNEPCVSGALSYSKPIVYLLSSSSHVTNPHPTIFNAGNHELVIANSRSSNYPGRRNNDASLHESFICGLGAALFEMTITYPINKLVFRQQVHGIMLKQAFGQLRQEGVRFLYRGMLFPLIQRSASRSIMFGTYDEYKRLLDAPRTEGRDGLIGQGYQFTWRHGLAAFAAGATEASLMPFERAQTLMQSVDYNRAAKNSFDALNKLLRPYGIREYYRGLSVIILRNGSTNILFLGLRNPIADFVAGQDRTETSHTRQLFANFVSGAILGAGLSTIFYPFTVIKANMQSQLGGKFERPHVVLYKILNERGFSIRQLYLGVSLNFYRSLLTWGLVNAGYEFLQWHLFGINKNAAQIKNVDEQ